MYFFFLLLNSVYTVLPLSQGLDRVKGGTIHMKTAKYVHTKLCLSVYIVPTERKLKMSMPHCIENQYTKSTCTAND